MSVDINFPLSGYVLGRSFTATGTASAAPTVTLDSAGLPTVTGATTFNGVSSWSSAFNLAVDYPDATLTATLGNDEATESNLTFSISTIRLHGATVDRGVANVALPTITAMGEVAPGVGVVVVTAIGIAGGAATFLGSSGVTIPAGVANWSVSITLDVLPGAGKILLRAQALNAKGKITGTSGHRIKL